MPPACYLPLGEQGPRGGDLLESTRLSAAEWYPDGQHGGVVSALIARSVERLPSLTPMEVSRVTVELFRIIPVTTLEVVVAIVRGGKRIQTVEVRLYDGEVEMARGLVQRLRITELQFPPEFDSRTRPKGPDGLPTVEFADIVPFPDRGLLTFGRGALTLRDVDGSFADPGPATVWFKVNTPLVAGEPVSGTQLAVLAADFSNGLSRLANGTEWVFMNSDLSVHLARPPLGKWVALQGQSIWHHRGRGVATSQLFDEQGPIGSATQTLFLDEGLVS